MPDTIIKYLIDTNSLITPYKTYYPFDFAEKFWEQLKNAIESGSIVILDMVKEELCKGDDELSVWVQQFDNSLLLNHKEPSIIRKYAEILQYVQVSEYYDEKALMDWSKDDVADPWLIATAHTYGYKIITFETPNPNLNKTNRCKRAKIPDVSNKFSVECENLYYMMRKLNFTI